VGIDSKSLLLHGTVIDATRGLVLDD